MGLFERFTRRGRSSDDGRPVVDATPDDAVTADELRDAARQVTGQAGDVQIEGARRIQTLNIGGSFGTVVSFVVESA